ncbi:Sterol desaturase/sphingolipid hydroxylase, fatty acid hydroxylase superfamily [Tenacibaculum sp. MAR_2009_124]|uniref:sterol desaturase family protein n=1 Tax=Tenacibaculum sp. MAR_2009_124 TaxID=1250059 RepID=UPI000896F5BF|nr:sterol desaturase family protein [Tenacibaculum sp. MAR_2009_124]SEC00507.1 Sterol desaturase/sphingolipid hydroxylase, fatty acid hydroxylase superfamily [Tenacibaculum sp. MAR_2009_124]
MNELLLKVYQDLEGSLGILLLIMVAIEWISLIVIQKLESNKEGFVNLLSFIIDSIPYFFLGRIFIFGTMVWCYEYKLFTVGYEWYIWIACFLLYDLMFYVFHYLGHRVRLFWCIHGVHHTAKEMKLTVAVRGSFLGILWTPLNFIWLPLLGFDPFMVFIVHTIGRFYGVYEHVNESFVGKQRWLEWLLITPSVHRAHHSSDHEYLDRNYGETFSIWDHLFGTFQSEFTDKKMEYGIMDDTIDGENFWQIQTILWRELWRDIVKAPTFLDKLKYIFKPPGWNHIDGGKLAESFREEALRERKFQLTK